MFIHEGLLPVSDLALKRRKHVHGSLLVGEGVAGVRNTVYRLPEVAKRC